MPSLDAAMTELRAGDDGSPPQRRVCRTHWTASACDRDEARAAALCGRIAAKGGVVPEADSLSLRGLDLLVHATPVGMAENDGTAIDIAELEPGTVVIDIVTKPITPLLRAAERRGCPTAGGGAMVQAQTSAIAEFLGYPLR